MVEAVITFVTLDDHGDPVDAVFPVTRIVRIEFDNVEALALWERTCVNDGMPGVINVEHLHARKPRP